MCLWLYCRQFEAAASPYNQSIRPKKTSVLTVALPKKVGTGGGDFIFLQIIFMFSLCPNFLNFMPLNVNFGAI